jgi:hypothetical protein
LKRPSANTPTRSYSIASDTSRKESWRERVQKALSVICNVPGFLWVFYVMRTSIYDTIHDEKLVKGGRWWQPRKCSAWVWVSSSIRPPIDYQREKLLRASILKKFVYDSYKGNPPRYDSLIITGGVLLTYILMNHYRYFCDPPSLDEILERIRTRGLETTLFYTHRKCT